MALNDLALDVPHQRIQLWGWPIRVFHWSLLAAVATAIVTGKLGGEWMPLHGKAGIAISGLLAFRISWGLIGASTARFAQFVPTPGRLVSYLQGRWRGVGHNPLGALSVLALIGLLGAQVVTGLFSNDDIAFAGPLSALIQEDLTQSLTGWHHRLVNVLFVLLGLHVVAIFFHVKFKKDNIVKPMVTGWKEVPADLAPDDDARWTALAVALMIGLGGAYAASGAWIEADAPVAAAASPVTSAPSQAAPSW
jgi:cytochrome b